MEEQSKYMTIGEFHQLLQESLQGTGIEVRLVTADKNSRQDKVKLEVKMFVTTPGKK